jgi:DNA-binding MarR family transcriptional regulator
MSVLSESAAVAETGRLLASWLEQPKPRIRIEDKRSGADLVAEQGRLRLVVEYKGAGESAIVGAAIRQAQEYAKRLGRGALAVVAVPYMGEVGKRLCAQAGVSWLDLSGNAHIVGPGVRIIIEGKPNRFPRRGRPSSAFAPKSARVARRLLMEPWRSFRQQDLSRETGLDDGFTSRIVRRLEEDGLLERAKDARVRVRDPDLLLDAWTEVYDFSKHTIVRGHIATSASEELVARLQKALDKSELRHAATGLAAAWLHSKFAGFRLVTFFVEKRPDEHLLREVGFREESKGANVWLVVPNDEGVFDGAGKKDRIDCVHPVQAYLDLQRHPERATEAAAELRARLLQWKH